MRMMLYALFMMSEKKLGNSRYSPYFDILPMNGKYFPSCFSDEELAYLEGSYDA